MQGTCFLNWPSLFPGSRRVRCHFFVPVILRHKFRGSNHMWKRHFAGRHGAGRHGAIMLVFQRSPRERQRSATRRRRSPQIFRGSRDQHTCNSPSILQLPARACLLSTSISYDLKWRWHQEPTSSLSRWPDTAALSDLSQI